MTCNESIKKAEPVCEQDIPKFNTEPAHHLSSGLIVEELESLLEFQKKKLLAIASEILPWITSDDVLQPNDFPELELHPGFRYEEGIVDGLQSALAIARLLSK